MPLGLFATYLSTYCTLFLLAALWVACLSWLIASRLTPLGTLTAWLLLGLLPLVLTAVVTLFAALRLILSAVVALLSPLESILSAVIALLAPLGSVLSAVITLLAPLRSILSAVATLLVAMLLSVFGLRSSFLLTSALLVLLPLTILKLTTAHLRLVVLTDHGIRLAILLLPLDGLQMHLKRLHGDVDFPDTDAERGGEHNHTRAENPVHHYRILYVNEKHRRDTKQEAPRPEYLHRADKLKSLDEVTDLAYRRRGGLRIAIVLILKVAHHRGVREEAIGIGQKNKRNGRE